MWERLFNIEIQLKTYMQELTENKRIFILIIPKQIYVFNTLIELIRILYMISYKKACL